MMNFDKIMTLTWLRNAHKTRKKNNLSFFGTLMCMLGAFGNTLLAVVSIKEESLVLVCPWPLICSLCGTHCQAWKGSNPSMCGCVHRLSTTEQNFGLCFRPPGQNKSLWVKVMMVLQRQLCGCCTVWLPRLGLRTAKNPSFSLMKGKTGALSSHAEGCVLITLVFEEGKHCVPRKPHCENDREVEKGGMQISHRNPAGREAAAYLDSLLLEFNNISMKCFFLISNWSFSLLYTHIISYSFQRQDIISFSLQRYFYLRTVIFHISLLFFKSNNFSFYISFSRF